MAVVVPGQLPGVDQVLFRLRGFNANAATGAGGSQRMERLIPAGSQFAINRLEAANGSISLTLATVGLGVAAGGLTLQVAAALAAVTGPTAGATIGTPLPLARGYNAATAEIWASLGVAQGAPATCDLYVIGRLI